MEQAIEWLVDVIHTLGYTGVFLMTLIESTFVPIPSEVTMLPVGFLVHEGKMSFWIAFMVSTSGTVAGAYINYWIAQRYGRKLFLKYGKWFRLDDAKLQWIERYFAKHGPISIFTGRLVPGVRHYISFPAGLAEMNLRQFCLYTALGGSIWMATLMGVGYFLGANQDVVKEYLVGIKVGMLLAIVALMGFYMWRHRRKSAEGSATEP